MKKTIVLLTIIFLITSTLFGSIVLADSKLISQEDITGGKFLLGYGDCLGQKFKTVPEQADITKISLYIDDEWNTGGNCKAGISEIRTIDESQWINYESKSINGMDGWENFNINCDVNPEDTYYLMFKLTTHDSGAAVYGSWENPYPNGETHYYNEASWETVTDCDLGFKIFGNLDQQNNPPNIPNNPIPDNGENDVNINSDLSWSCSDPDGDTVYYDVYFEANDNTPDEKVSNHQTSTSYDPGTLSYETTYYWQIIAEDEHGATTPGPTWHYTTKESPDNPPQITEIKPYYADGSEASDNTGFLIERMDLENTYTAFVTDASYVEFEFGSQLHRDNDGSDGWTATFNSKNIYPNDEIVITAYNSKGTDTKTIHPRIIPKVGWLINFLNYVANYNDTDFASFSIEVKEPEHDYNNYWQLTAAVDFSTGSPDDEDEPPVEAEVPGGVPVDDVGGKYSFSGGVGSSISICSDETIIVTGGFQAGVEAKSIGGEIGAQLFGDISINNNEIIWNEMYITINGKVTIPVFLVPLKVCGIGVEAGIVIEPHVDITFNLDPVDNPSGGIVPGLGIKISDDSGAECAVGALVKAYAELGFVIGDFYCEAGGDGTLYFRTPPGNNGYFDNFVLQAWIKGKIRLLCWTASGEWSYTWSNNSMRSTGKDYSEEAWAPISREYKNQNQYGSFIWDNIKDSGTVIKNAFPHANPKAASFPGTAGTKQMIVWSHDNKNKPEVKGMELWYTIWNNGHINQPQKISPTNDNLIQMDAQLGFDSDGDAICVFTQTDSSIDANSEIDDVMNAMEIAYTEWNGNSWESIQSITDNNKMDSQPVLASDSNGDIVLVWTSDSDNDIKTINDRSLYATFWDGDSWSEIKKPVENQAIISTPQVAINNPGLAECVFTIDSDGDVTTTKDQELTRVTITNGGLGETSICSLTENNYQEVSPSVVYGKDGEAYAVWLRNNYHTQNNQDIYDGKLYYSQISGVSFGGNTEHEITTGEISNPVAFSPSASTNLGDKYADVNFAVGWSSDTSSRLNCALVKTNNEIETGVIYTSEKKLSEIDWCMSSGSITAVGMERETINSGNNCDVTFVKSQGFDRTPPQTQCFIDGNKIGQGEHGPIYLGDVEISLSSSDTGGSGVDSTYYKLDDGAMVEYNGPITISIPTDHKIRFYSIDKADNEEEIKTKNFEIIQNRKPTKPSQPSGKTKGPAGEEYIYSTSSTDPDGDPVYYLWDWEDAMSNWIGPYNSGETITAKHTWKNKGKFNVRVKAKDDPNGDGDLSDGVESDWSDPLVVSMPKNKETHLKPINILFEYIFHRFPIISRLLNLLLK